MTDLGLIVGSGRRWLELDVAGTRVVDTPYGPPSGPVATAMFGRHAVPCLARHGEPHRLAPHEVNYRANVRALYDLGVRRVIAVNVVGAIAPDFAPGELAVPEQLIDYTWGRESTFGAPGGGVLHVEFDEPFDAPLRASLAAAIEACGFRAHGGVYGVTQGPRLETAAEIDRLERDGCTMVGMTAMPEAALARELGMAYAVCALAVNFAAGRGPRGEGILAAIERHLATGMRRVRLVLDRVVPELCGDGR
ncbi:MAG TPA: S-methyl-5'-thioinosine phosphorylase [Gammaproteobacteria bacterium]